MLLAIILAGLLILRGNFMKRRLKKVNGVFTGFYSEAEDVCMMLVPVDRDDLAIQVSKFGG